MRPLPRGLALPPVLCAVVAASIATASVVTAPAASAASGHDRVDFDNDGLADQAFGAPGGSNGAIYVTLGSGGTYVIDGVDVDRAWSLGNALATCDVNGDNVTDLVAGDPDAVEVDGDVDYSGGVFVFYGSAGILSAPDFWSQDSAGVPGTAELGDGLGYSVACGDYNGDGYADVVAGAPGENVGSRVEAGSVTLLFGSMTGLTASGSRTISQDSTGVAGTAESDDLFGHSVAMGDVTGDGLAEVIVGALGENDFVGQVHSFAGSSGGWSTSGSTVVYGGAVGQSGFGQDIAPGSFDGTGALDVAVSGDGSDVTGAVTVLKASSANLSSTGAKTITQSTSGVPGTAESGDWFGESIDAGDVNGDFRDDLLVGNFTEDIGTVDEAGNIVLLKGSSTGLTGTGSQSFSQDSTDVPGTAETADGMGQTVALVDVDGDAYLDAAVGTPSEDLGSTKDAGSITLLPGSSGGLTAIGASPVDTSDFGPGPAANDRFGLGLAG